MIPVIVESPYASQLVGGARSEMEALRLIEQREEEVERNRTYARMAIRDCLLRGEAPFASHLLYTQPGVLDDLRPDERAQGIEAGFTWAKLARRAVFYLDHGMSPGMKSARELYEYLGYKIQDRYLFR